MVSCVNRRVRYIVGGCEKAKNIVRSRALDGVCRAGAAWMRTARTSAEVLTLTAARRGLRRGSFDPRAARHVNTQ